MGRTRRFWRRGESWARIATLAVGLGLVLAMVCVSEAVLYRPFDYPGASRVVDLSEYGPMGSGVAVATFQDWQRRTEAFDAMAADRYVQLPLASGGGASTADVEEVTAGYFELAGLRLTAGSGLAAGTHAAVVNHDALPDARLGAALTLGGAAYTVTGLVSAGADGTQIWISMPAAAAAAGRNARDSFVLARLRPGVTLAAAGADLARVERQLEASFAVVGRGPLPGYAGHPASAYHGWSTSVHSSQASATMFARGPAELLLGAAGLLLLLCCANASGLNLVEAARRRHELAVRRMLGAGRGRILRDLLGESLALAAVAAAAGAAVAWAGSRALVAMLPAPLRRPLAAHGGALAWDGRVLAAGLALIAVAALLSGLAPAWSAARGLDETALRSGTRPLMGPRRRGLRLLVAAECLLAMLLLAGAALMLRTWTGLRQTSLGFDVSHVVLIGPCVPTAAAECAQLARRAAASPGVSATGATDDFPLGETTTFVVASTPTPHPAVIGDVSAGYFRAMGMTIAPGRGYGPGEAAAAVVSIGAARAWWPGQPAVGQHFTFNQHVYTVVGVAPDVERTPHRSNTLPFQPPQFPQIYVPPTAAAPTPITVIHATDAATLAASLRAEARQDGARQAAAAVTTGAEVLAGHMQTERGMASLLGLFAVLALAVAAGGVFTLMAFAARTRRQEAGIRLALGAAPARLAWQFGREGLVLALAGVALGLAMVTRLAQPLLGAYLYGVRPTDAATLASAAALLVALAAAACALPALAAARTDPAQVLRQE